jgi:23S rRNA pseudouridine2457 synthase
VLYKPFDVLSQFTAEEPGQRTLAEFGLPKEVNVAGRLDRDSEGLLLLTTDGRLIKRLLDPQFGHPRRYWAQVEGEPTAAALAALAAGVDIRIGKSLYHTRPCQVRLIDSDSEPALPPRDPPIRYRATIPTRWLELTLDEGKNRQVRKMTAAVGFPTLRLVRAAFGRLEWNEGPLRGLQPGQWVEVSGQDIKAK